jgi:membrane-bound inhibitor of C-type lysozyme
MTRHNFITVAVGSALAWPFRLGGRLFRVFLLGVGLLSILAAEMVGITLAAAQNTVFHTFHCDDGTDLVVAFYWGERRAHVQLDGKAMTLPRRLSFSHARYSGGGITLRIKENAATLSRGRNTTECSSS